MKKSVSFLLVVVMVFSMQFSFSQAATNEIKILLDEQYLEMDVPPVIVNDRTLVPTRAVVEKLGGHVDWIGEKNLVIVTKGDISILITVNEETAYVNGAPVILDVPAQIVNSRTLIPLRFVAENLGVVVDFYENTVMILSDKNRDFAKSKNIIDGIATTDDKDIVKTEQMKTISTEQSPSLSALVENRSLSDEQIKALSMATPEKLREEIFTVGDAIAFLNMTFPSLWHSYHLWQGQNSKNAVLRSGEEILRDRHTNFAGRSDMSTVVSYLLSDDCTINTVYGFWFAAVDDMNPIKSACIIEYQDKYYIFDPVTRMEADMDCRYGDIFDDTIVDKLSDYVAYIRKNSQLSEPLSVVYLVPSGVEVNFTAYGESVSLNTPASEPIFKNADRYLAITPEEYEQNKYDYIREKLALNPENISKYKLPTILGGLTMTPKEARELVNQTPEVIKSKVKTAGDLLLYMLAAEFILKNGDEQITVDGKTWHYNLSAKDVINQRIGNCGRMANLANYLLEGDYDEIGFILHSYAPKQGGGHVYNYIKYQNKYYIVDFSSYLFNDYDVASEFNFISMDNLKDYSTRHVDCFGDSLVAIIAHTSKGTHLPNVWENDLYGFPDDAQFDVIFEKPNGGYRIGTLKCPASVPNWRTPQ